MTQQHNHSNEEEEIQQRYVQLQLISQQINQIREQLEYVSARIMEMDELNHNLEQMKSWEGRKEILAPIGMNTFVRAELKDSNEVIMDVGSKVMLSKSIESAKETNKLQIDELREFSLQITNELSRLSHEHSAIESELASIIQKTQAPQEH